MTSESLTWKLKQDMCRCCHSEGSFRSISDPWNHAGQQEIYSDMLKDCFDVHISPVPGPLCAVTYTMCQACVLKLRAALNFKKQVLYCEERFREMYSKNFIIVVTDSNPAVKVEDQDTIQDDFKEEYFPNMDDDVDDDEHRDDDFNLNFDNDEEEAEIVKEPKKQKKAKPKSNKNVEKRILRVRKVREPPLSTELEDATETKTTKKGGRVRKSKGCKKNVRKQLDKPGKFSLNEEDYTKNGDLYHCARCEKTYDKVDSLRFHVKIKHYKIPRYHCPYCSKEFMTPAPLTVHKLEDHDIDDRFKCKACKGIFNTQVQLKKHINNFHMLGEKYKCECCDYESFSFESMYKHKFKHKTVKDYHCRFCKKSFLRKTTLDLHERIHTGDRRQVCSVCGTAFVQKASLNYHMTKYHPEVNY